MDSDVDDSPWVLELLLRERSNDKRVLAFLPIADDDGRMKKTLLLKSIESEILDTAAVTEAILDSLKSIELLDRGRKVPITDSMRAAYCAVATELTVKFLAPSGGTKPGRKYVEAVERIWRGRVRVLEEDEGCGLVSAELKERREEVEAGIRDIEVSKRLASLDSRNDALRLVAEYVEEALAILGPQFIDMGKEFGGEQVAVENDDNVGKGCEVPPVCVVNEAELEVPMENVIDLTDESDLEANGANGNSVSEMEPQMVNGAKDVTSELGMPRTDVANGSEQEGHDTNVVGEQRSPSNGNRGVLSFEPATKEKESASPTAVRRRHGPAKISDDDNMGTKASVGIYNSVANAELQEELESGDLPLQAQVTDPLFALRVSEMIRSVLAMRPVDHVSEENKGAAHPSVEKNAEPDQSKNENHGNQTSRQNDVPQPIGKESCAPNLSVDKGRGTENDQTSDVECGNPCSSWNNVPRAGLMERNSTSRTYEWDDSLDIAPESTINNSRFHLPSPKVNAFSTLERYEDERFPKRRKIRRWSSHEEDTLRAGVQKYGRSWKRILEAHQDVFEDRTDVDLKDKWRNMTR